MGPIPRIRSYRGAGYSYDPLDPYAGQEFGRPAVPPPPGPAVGPPPVNPMIADIEAGRFEEYEPPVPPSPVGGYEYQEPASVKALREHAQDIPEYERPPWWKQGIGLALSAVNVAPLQELGSRLYRGDYPRKVGEWKAKQEALEKAANEEAGLTKGRMTFEQQRLGDEADLAEKGLVQVDINDPEFKRSDYETLTTVGSKVWGKPKERITAKEVAKDTREVPRSVFEAAGLQHLLKPGEQSRRMSNKEAEELFGNYLEQIKPTTLGAGQVKIGGPGQKPLAVGPPRLITDYPTARTSKIDPLTSEATEIRKHPITERQPRAAGAGTKDPYLSTKNQITSRYSTKLQALRREAKGKTEDFGNGIVTRTAGLSPQEFATRKKEIEDELLDDYRTLVPEEHWPETIRAKMAGDEDIEEVEIPTSQHEDLLPGAAQQAQPAQRAQKPSIPPPPGPAVGPPPGAQDLLPVPESSVNAIAAQLGIDPMEYRRNAAQYGARIVP